MDAKRENIEVCVLEPEDFLADDEDRVEDGEIFRSGDDIRYFAERIRKGTDPIRGRKL